MILLDPPWPATIPVGSGPNVPGLVLGIGALGQFVDGGEHYYWMLCAAANGLIYTCQSTFVVLRFPPMGPYRLALGWAEKGPDGSGR